MSNCNCHTSPNRDGSGRLQRYLVALDPSYAKIDSRNIEDLLVFIRKYANQVRFFDIPGSSGDNTPDDITQLSWSEFFRRDLAVTAASIMLTDVTAFKTEYEENRAELEMATTPHHFGNLFDPILGMAAKLDSWLSLAIPGYPLHTDLLRIIQSGLKPAMKKIQAYEEAYRLIDAKHPLKLDYTPIQNDSTWGLTEEIVPDASIYTGISLEDKMLNAMLYVDDVFNTFYGIMSSITEDGEKYLALALEQYPRHQPHMTLFIAFLRLFSIVQEQMNGVTGRMLNFYYRDVLRLEEKPSIPDRVHIVFELAKDVFQYDVAAGTSLNGGVDKSNKKQVYKTNTDLVVNQAKVKELKTIFIDKSADEKTIQQIYARPVANSADGLGAPFKTDKPKWPTFGKGRRKREERPKNICNEIEVKIENKLAIAPALTGFAIASPQLLLQGGNRIIALELNIDAEKMPPLKTTSISLTGEKGWLNITESTLTDSQKQQLITIFKDGGDLSTVMPETSGCFFDTGTMSFYVYLPVGEKAILAYDSKLHADYKFITTQPVMQVLLGPVLDFDATMYESLRMVNMSLAVRVGSVFSATQPAFNLTGQILDAQTNQPIKKPVGADANWIVGVYEAGSKPVKYAVADVNGNYTISTSVGKVLMFGVTSGYKAKIVKVADENPINISLAAGEGTEAFDYSLLGVPSFFDGLKQLDVQNDDGPVNPAKPFDPFTAYPKKGSALYIGSNEIFNKPIQQLSVHIKHLSEEADAIFDLAGVGANSETSVVPDIYKLSVLQNKSWTPLVDKGGTDFSEGQLSQNVIRYRKDNAGNTVPIYELQRTPISNEETLSETTVKGYIQIQNNYFPGRTKDNGVRASVISSNSGSDLFQIMTTLAVYFKIKEISVSYYSRLGQLEQGIDQLFHVYPFGVVETYVNKSAQQEIAGVKGEVTEVVVTGGTPVKFNSKEFEKADQAADYLLVQADNKLLPQYTWKSDYAAFNQEPAQPLPNEQVPVKVNANGNKATGNTRFNFENIVAYASGARSLNPGNNQYSGSIQEEGMLFIGLENLEPLQSVSILFQFADGSAEDEDQDPPEIHWSYLTNNEWRPMSGESIVSDGTYGFQTTGIVKIDVPEDITTNNTIITGGLVWFMASVAKNANRIPMLVDVVTQAVEATFEDNDNDQSHFDDALPAGTISKLTVAVAEVSKVSQPFASFDGKPEETGKEYYMRVSERLRHKGRAINAWDYEHLVLDRFPSIYKVKALNHLDPECLCRNTSVAVAATPAEENNNPVVTKLEGAYNSDGFINEADTQALKDAVGKITAGNVTAAEIIVNVITPAEISMAEKVGEKIKDFLVSSGIKAGSISLTTKPGTERTYGLSITEKATAKAAAAGDNIIATYTLVYARAGLDAASKAKTIEAALKTKSDVQFSADVQLFYLKPEEKETAEGILKEIDSEFSKAGVPGTQYKLSAVTGSSGTGLITITAPVVIPEPVPVTKSICCGPQIAPGHVLVVPIANLKNRNTINPLQPKTGRRTLLEIEAYLQKRTSPFVKVHAKNPVYEQVITVFRVKFYTGTDKGYYLKKLNEEIVHFLTPWAFDETADVRFGGEIYSSSIINFIEERPYVDFITDFYMLACVDACCPPVQVKKERDPYQEEQTPAEILSQFCNCQSFEELLQSGFDGLVVARPSTPRSILVSVPQHIIIPYEEPQRDSECEKRKKQKTLGPVKAEAAAEEAIKPVAIKTEKNTPAKPAAAPVTAPVAEKELPKDSKESVAKKTTVPVKPAAAKAAVAKPAVAKPVAAKTAVAKKAAPKPKKKTNK